jgi:hypothetical protein
MRLDLDRLWLFLALALPALASLIAPLPAVDLAYQVRAGELILATGQVPSTDTFTFTVAGTPWLDQQWLAQVLLALGFRAGGWELLAVVRAALVALAFGLVAATAMARGASPRTASILSLVAFAISAPALALRPQLFGIVVFAALLWLVADRERHPGRLWLVPLLVVLWANVHGSVVLAPVLLGYAWLDDVVRRRPSRASLAVLLAGTLATVVTPFGPGVWTYAVGIGVDPEIAGQVSEWQRTTPFTVPGLLFYGSAIAALVVAVWGRARLSRADWLWLATLLVIGAWAVRGLAWWPTGAVLIVAAALPAAAAVAGPHPARRPNRLNTAVAGVLGAAILLALPWLRPADPLAGRSGLLTYAPTGLAAAVRDTAPPGARVFVPQTWASWFEWAAPDARYFLDSRFELFPADVWHDYDAIARGGPAAAAALDRWGVGLIVVPTGSPSLGPGWTVVHDDADGTILIRSPE